MFFITYSMLNILLLPRLKTSEQSQRDPSSLEGFARRDVDGRLPRHGGLLKPNVEA